MPCKIIAVNDTLARILRSLGGFLISYKGRRNNFLVLQDSNRRRRNAIYRHTSPARGSRTPCLPRPLARRSPRTLRSSRFSSFSWRSTGTPTRSPRAALPHFTLCPWVASPFALLPVSLPPCLRSAGQPARSPRAALPLSALSPSTYLACLLLPVSLLRLPLPKLVLSIINFL